MSAEFSLHTCYVESLCCQLVATSCPRPTYPNMSTDTLAAAQLELLYRLGVLERDPPTPHQAQHQHPTLRGTDIGSSGWPKSISAGNGGPKSVLSSSAMAVPVHPLQHGLYDTSLVRESSTTQYSSNGVDSQYQHQPFSTLTPTRRERSRTWFLQWKLFVRAVHEQRNVSAIWCFRVKKRAWSALRSWCDRQLRSRLLAQMLQEQWKVRRATRKWRLWTCTTLRLRVLQGNARFSLMSRHRRRRVWLQWRQFATRRSWRRAIVEARQQAHSSRLLRAAWNELKAVVCMSRQRRRHLRKCLLALKASVKLTEAKRVWLCQAQTRMNKNTTQRLLRAWRHVTQLRVATCRIKRRIALEVSRKRYFRIWRRCLRDNHRIAELRAGRRSRLLRDHILAWLVTSRASVMGRTKSVATRRATRERYFQAWRRETDLMLRCHNAAYELDQLRQTRALRTLRSWATERRGQHQKLDVWRLRALTRIWRRGLLAFHRAQQEAKAEAKRFDLELQRTVFIRWVRLRRTRVEYRAAMHNASLFALRVLLKRCFSRLGEYQRTKVLSKQQLAHGDGLYRFRLLQRGVDELAHLVAQRSELSERSLHVRRQARASLRTRFFAEWRRWTRERQAHALVIARFREREVYQCSWFNPCRRGWDTWRAFVATRAQLKRVTAVHHRKLRRSVLHQWHHRARLHRVVAKCELEQLTKTMEIVFSKWRSRVSHWQGMREVLALAQAVHRRKRCGRVLHAWMRWTRHSAQVKLRCYRLERAASLRTLAISFRTWRVRLRQHTKLRRLEAARDAHWKTNILRGWREYAVRRVRLRRKLVYFRQVFGRHPTTSPVRGGWLQWRQYTRVSRGVRSLQRRQRLNIMRTTWRQWGLFHFHNLLFREWRRIAVHTAGVTHHFGQRLRLFYASMKDRSRSRTLNRWRALCTRKKLEREALLHAKRHLLRGIVTRHAQLSLAKAKYAHKWVSRWRRGANARGLAASRYFEAKLTRRCLVVWWRFMVNAKQEFVLSEAKQALGGLSFYHPHQQLYTRIVKEKAKSLRATAKADRSEAKMKRMRRMLDPETARTYLKPALPDHDATVSSERTSRADVGRLCQPRRRVAYEQNENDSRNFGGTAQETRYSSSSAVRKPREQVVPRPRAAQVRPPCPSFQDTRGLEHTLRPTADTTGQGAHRVVAHELPLFDLPSPARDQLRETRVLTTKPNGDSTTLQRHEEQSRENSRLPASNHIPLPLTDDGARSVQAQSCVFQLRNAVAQEPLQTSEDENSLHTTCDDLSLSQLASMELLAPLPRDMSASQAAPQEPQATRAVDFDHRQKSSDEADIPRAPAPSQTYQKRSKKASPTLSLSAILDVPEASKAPPKLNSTAAATIKTTRLSRASKPAELSPNDILREVLAHYTKQLVDAAVQSKRVEDITARHHRVCFQMLRDLGLFHNQFYLPQMQRAMDSISLDRILFAHERLGASDTSDERAYLQQVEAEFLKQFLSNAIERHPLFDIAVLKHEECGRDDSVSSSPAVDALTLQWLAAVHLRPWVESITSKSRAEKPFWINASLPPEVDAALEKLIMCISKYFKVLAQLYSTRVGGSRPQQRSSDCQPLSKSEFAHLLKCVHVFPQLLTRRELESAFDASCCSRPDQKEISFPEFVEALVRCSSGLQWGDSSANETGVVVRFLMLLFAMEGKGTVLHKRSEDLQVVVGVLEQQQAQSKAAKLHRFRSLLAEQKRVDTSATSSSQYQHQSRQARRPSWRRSSGLVSPRNKCSSPRRNEEPDLFFFDDTGNTKSSVALDDRAEPLDMGLRVGFSLHEASETVLDDSIELSSPVDSPSGRYRHPPPSPAPANTSRELVVRRVPQQSALSSPVDSYVAVSPVSLPTGVDEADRSLLATERHGIGADHASGYEMQPIGTSMMEAGDACKTSSGERSTASKAAYHVGELRDGDAFVREILNSIGDVELLLHQSNLQLGPSVHQGKRARASLSWWLSRA